MAKYLYTTIKNIIIEEPDNHMTILKQVLGVSEEEITQVKTKMNEAEIDLAFNHVTSEIATLRKLGLDNQEIKTRVLEILCD